MASGKAELTEHMGFRSTFSTSDYNIKWPDWFKKKYERTIYIPDDCGSLASKMECKTYFSWPNLIDDIQKAINWDWLKFDFVVAFLHEDGAITRCTINKDSVKYAILFLDNRCVESECIWAQDWDEVYG